MSTSVYKKYFQNLLTVLFTLLVFGLIGCSGGGGDTSSSSNSIVSYQLSGKVQKGQFLDGTILARKLEDNGSFDTTHIVEATIDEDGKYSLHINWNGPTFLQAEGHYFDEYSDRNSSQKITLEALTDVNSSKNININLLSSLESSRVLELLKTDANFSAAEILAKENLEQIFSHPKSISTTDLDMFDFNSSLTDANKNLLLLSALFLKVTQEDETLSTSTSSSARAPNRGGKKSLSLSKLKSDFSKNGKVDTVFKAKWEEIIEEDIVAVSKKVSKNIDIEVSYVVPPTHWSKRLQLSVSTPQYIFDGSKLQKIIYDVNIPLANYTDRSRVYKLSYSTSDNSARAGSEYTSVSGNFSFSFTHNSGKIIIDVLSQSADSKIFNLNFVATTKGLSLTNPRLEVEIFQNTISLASRPSILSLSLDSIDVDGLSSSISPRSSVVFVGNSTSRVNLGIAIEASTSRPAEYFANVYAIAPGQLPLKLAKVFMTTLGDVGGRVFYQSADLTVELDSVLKVFLQTAYTNSEEVKLFAEIIIDESSSTNLSSYALPQLVQVSTSLSSNVEISTFEYLEALDSSCNSTSQSRFDATTLYAKVNMYGLFSASYLNTPIGIEYDGVCVKMEYDAVKREYGLTLESGEGILDADMQIEVYGNNLTLSKAKVSNTSITPQSITISLPKGHTIHKRGFFNNISPRGEKSITFTPKRLNISDNLSLATYTGEFPQEVYLHGKNLPFYLKLQKVILDASSLRFSSDAREYIFGYSNSKRNNTSRFSKPESGVYSFELGIDGISSKEAVPFESTRMQTHFPKAEIDIAAFSVKIKKSEIVRSRLAGNEIHHSEYKQNCPMSECIQTQKSAPLVLNTTQTNLYSDGSTISTNSEQNISIEWGEKGERAVFQRDRDKGVTIYTPGYILPTNDPQEIGAYLYGSVSAVTSELKRYMTTETEAKSGKYLYAGINIGLLENSNAASTLAPVMSVRIADGIPLLITNSKDTKYYIRNAGITGVFNNIDEVYSKTVYGYTMNLKSFKFRQVNNKIDKYTKIDGDLHIPNLGNFDVAFKNLSVDCSGNFQGGSIDKREEDLVLQTWQMSAPISEMSFKNSDGSVCSNNKELWLGHLLKVAALKEKVEIGTFWNPIGEPHGTIVIANSENQLDGDSILDENVSNGGYDISIKKISLNYANGTSGKRAWVEADTKVGLVFWGAQDMSIRMTNTSPVQRDHSVVTKKGELYSESRKQYMTNEQLVNDIRATYEHNISRKIFNVLDFSLPVYYNSKKITNIPKFIGRPYEKDLIVFKTNAVVNEITPTTTQVTLGAGATLLPLKEPKLHIDLNDPDSLKNLDSNLSKYLPVDTPLQKSIGKIFDGAIKLQELLSKSYISYLEVPFYQALQKVSLLESNDPFLRMGNTKAATAKVLPSILYRYEANFYNKMLEALDTQNQESSDTLRKVAMLKRFYNQYLLEIDDAVTELREYSDLQDDASLLNKVREYTYKYGIGTPENNCSWENMLEQQIDLLDDINKTVHTGNKYIITTKDVAFLATNLQEFDADKTIKNLLPYVANKKYKEKLENIRVKIEEFQTTKVADSYDKYVKWVNDDFCKLVDISLQSMGDFNTTLAKIDKDRHDVINALNIHARNLTVSDFGRFMESLDTLNQNSDMSNLKSEFLRLYAQDIEVEFLEMKNLSRNINFNTDEDYRKMFVTSIMELDAMEKMSSKATEIFLPMSDSLFEVVLSIFGIHDEIVKDIFSKVNDAVSSALDSTATRFKKIPLDTANIDGYAIFGLDEIHRLHISANYTTADDDNNTDNNETESSESTPSSSASSGGSFGSGSKSSSKKKEKEFSFIANLDIYNEAYDAVVGCGNENTEANIRTVISTEFIKMKLLKKELEVDYLEIGVTLGSDEARIPDVKGAFGAISSRKGMEFSKVKLYDMGLAIGMGPNEKYVGAKVSGQFSSFQLGMSFLVGKVCNPKVIEVTLPEAISEFITVPNDKFDGYALYGEGQMPVYQFADDISIGLRAKLGFWSIEGPPEVSGGLIGGGVFGTIKIIDIVGDMVALKENAGGKIRYAGEGWIAGGKGLKCDYSTWKTVEDSRKNKKCQTMDVTFEIANDNDGEGWKFDGVKTNPDLSFLSPKKKK